MSKAEETTDMGEFLPGGKCGEETDARNETWRQRVFGKRSLNYTSASDIGSGWAAFHR
jgi:hypothetical protein